MILKCKFWFFLFGFIMFLFKFIFYIFVIFLIDVCEIFFCKVFYNIGCRVVDDELECICLICFVMFSLVCVFDDV